MFPFLFVLFILTPLAELYVIIQIGQWIGALPTIAILLVDSILGAALLKSQGRAAWGRFRLALNEARLPHSEVADGALVIVGGALLLTPGFLTDGAGLALLLPPSRAAVRRTLMAVLSRRLVPGASAGARRWRNRD